MENKKENKYTCPLRINDLILLLIKPEDAGFVLYHGLRMLNYRIDLNVSRSTISVVESDEQGLSQQEEYMLMEFIVGKRSFLLSFSELQTVSLRNLISYFSY